MTLQEQFRLNLASRNGQTTVQCCEILVFYCYLLAVYLMDTLFHIFGLMAVKKQGNGINIRHID